MRALLGCSRSAVLGAPPSTHRASTFGNQDFRRASPRPERSLVLRIYARDGKRRRPKTDPTQKVEAPQPTSPPPPRVQVHSIIPARTQIKIVREYKQRMETAAYRQKRKVNPNYRKEALAPDDYRAKKAQYEADAAELSKKESKNFALSSLYQTNARAARYGAAAITLPPILLVDGYNVMFKWERTSKYLMQGQLDVARDILMDALSTYSHTNGVRVVVAFDAMHGSLNTTDEKLLSTGVTEVFCGDCEADSFIESQVDVWLQRRHPLVVVATSDIAQKTVVDSKKGPDNRQIVYVVPSSGLCKEIEATEKRMEERLFENEIRNFSVHTLGSAVKSKNQDAFSELERLRRGMPRNSTTENPPNNPFRNLKN